MSLTLGLILAAGGAAHGHGQPPPPAAYEIRKLLTCPNWRERDDAAAALRQYDWECQPEIVDALSRAVVDDCHKEVREEAAESLAKLAPCVPCAHAALEQATGDPYHGVRKWARRALKNMDRRCTAPCDVCGPSAISQVAYAPPSRPTLYVPTQYQAPVPGFAPRAPRIPGFPVDVSRLNSSLPIPSADGTAYYDPPSGPTQLDQHTIISPRKPFPADYRMTTTVLPGGVVPPLEPAPPSAIDTLQEPALRVPPPPPLEAPVVEPTSYSRPANNLAPLLAAPRNARVVVPAGRSLPY